MKRGPRQTNWPADKKMLPAIPLSFDEVMGDVLKMKPPEKVPRKKTRKKKSVEKAK